MKPDLYISYFQLKMFTVVNSCTYFMNAFICSWFKLIYETVILVTVIFVTNISLRLYWCVYMICFVNLTFFTRSVSFECCAQGKTSFFCWIRENGDFIRQIFRDNGLFFWNIQGCLFQNCATNPDSLKFGISLFSLYVTP